MYVCVCNAIRQSDLEKVALRTGGDATACYAALGKRPNCGTCLDDAELILEQIRDRALVPAAA